MRHVFLVLHRGTLQLGVNTRKILHPLASVSPITANQMSIVLVNCMFCVKKRPYVHPRLSQPLQCEAKLLQLPKKHQPKQNPAIKKLALQKRGASFNTYAVWSFFSETSISSASII